MFTIINAYALITHIYTLSDTTIIIPTTVNLVVGIIFALLSIVLFQ